MPPTPRRSARKRKTNINYDDFDHTTFESVRDPASPIPEEQQDKEPQDIYVPDAEYGSADARRATNQPGTPEREPISQKGLHIAMLEETISDTVTTPTTLSKKQVGKTPEKQTKRPLSSQADEEILRTRSQHGTYDKLRSAKDKVHTANYGPLVEDLYPILQARDLWLKSRDATLPSRKTLTEALLLSSKGQYPSMKEKVAHSIVEHLDFGSNQLLEPLAEEIYRSKYSSSTAGEYGVVLGPFSTSIVCRLSKSAPTNTGKAWPMNQDAHASWLIDIGAKPLSMSWAPSVNSTQHLATSLKSFQHQREKMQPTKSHIAPAFTASAPYPASIQVWRLYTQDSLPGKISRLDHADTPVLSQVICTNWGDCTQLEWYQHTQDLLVNTRALGVLSTDGVFRVVNIDLSTTATTYLHVQKPSRAACPPPWTIFTCFCFATTSDLILGCGDGTVQLFDLRQHDLSPYATIQIHATYIMGLAVASDYPHYLSTTSAGGELTLTDLRNPTQERIPVHRSRLPTRNMCYLPLTRHFMTTSDSSGNSETYGTTVSTVTAHNLRHYYQGTTILKLPESAGIATALATSPFHPTILAANAAGSVFATNYLRKVLPLKRSESGAQAYMHKIFDYDWQPQQETDYRDTTGLSLYHGRDVRPGLSRFHEIFEPEKVSLATPSARGGGGENKATKDSVDGGSTTQVVLPEEQAVTTMCWNGNPRCSGWVAIGWGSGLLRILDLSHDVV